MSLEGSKIPCDVYKLLTKLGSVRVAAGGRGAAL